MAGRTSTTWGRGSGIPAGGASAYGGATGTRPAFTADTQPPPEHKSAGMEARAEYLAELRTRQGRALEVIDRALDLAMKAEDAAMMNVGVRTALSIGEAIHGRPTQAVTGDGGGPLTVVVRRLTDDA